MRTIQRDDEVFEVCYTFFYHKLTYIFALQPRKTQIRMAKISHVRLGKALIPKIHILTMSQHQYPSKSQRNVKLNFNMYNCTLYNYSAVKQQKVRNELICLIDCWITIHQSQRIETMLSRPLGYRLREPAVYMVKSRRPTCSAEQMPYLVDVAVMHTISIINDRTTTCNFSTYHQLRI